MLRSAPAPRRAPWPLAAAALLAAAGLAACAGRAAPPPPNLVLIVVDTLRADHVGAYGAARRTTLALDRLARESVVFERARTLAPCTFPSVDALLTSRHPARFGAHAPGDLGIPAELPVLPALLRRRGYRTAAVSASPVVRARPGEINRRGGFGRGFDLFLDDCTWRDGRCVTRGARTALALLPEPFFLYLHYLDPHDPYRPPPGAATRRFAGSWSGRAEVAAGDPRPAAARLYAGGATPAPGAAARRRAGLDAGELAHLVDLYDDEVVFADRQLADLLAALEARGVRDRAVVVVLSDHGESFLEHGHLRHCRSLYEEEVRVPLIVHLPAGRAARIATPVTLLDVAPTLLELAGIDPRALPLEGHSLLRRLRDPAAAEGAGSTLRARRPGRPDGAAGEPPPEVASAGAWWSLRQGRWKLLVDRGGGGAVRLYDLAADPGERRDLAPARPALVRRLTGKLDRALVDLAPAGAPAAPALDELRALGYLD